MSAAQPPLGIDKSEMDTPALCLDLDVMESNIIKMVELCNRHHINWRPHAKCHKSPIIGRRLVEAGAIGLTVAKLGEAEVMVAGGIHDLLIANLIVGEQKLQRLAKLCQESEIVVCVDHLDQARALSQTMVQHHTSVRVIIEIDIGLCRVGVLPGEPTLELARKIIDLPGIRLAGVMGYEGHLLKIEDAVDKEESIRKAISLVSQSKAMLEANGIPCPIVSCGGTGSMLYTPGQPGISELQAGGAIFMDAFYRNCCKITQQDFALTVTSTVVSRPAADRAIVDAGRKTMNAEIYSPMIKDRNDISLQHLSAEHGILKIHDQNTAPSIGDRIEFIPGYADLTINLHDNFYGFRNNRLAEIIPVQARGFVR